MINEEQHPTAKGVERRHRGSEVLLGSSKLVNFAAIDRFNQQVTGREMAVKGAGSNDSLTCYVVKARGGAITREDLLSDLQDALAVTDRIRARLSYRWVEVLFRLMQFENIC